MWASDGDRFNTGPASYMREARTAAPRVIPVDELQDAHATKIRTETTDVAS